MTKLKKISPRLRRQAQWLREAAFRRSSKPRTLSIASLVYAEGIDGKGPKAFKVLQALVDAGYLYRKGDFGYRFTKAGLEATNPHKAGD